MSKRYNFLVFYKYYLKINQLSAD